MTPAEIKSLAEQVKRSTDTLHTNYATLQSELNDLKCKAAQDVIVTEKLDRITNSLADTQAKNDHLARVIDQMALANGRASVAAAGIGESKAEKMTKAAMSYLGGKTIPHNTILTNDQVAAYEKAFAAALRKNGSALGAEEFKALSIGSDPAGGFLVPDEMYNTVLGRIYESSPVRSLATTISVSSDTVKVPVDWDDESVDQAGELSQPAASDKEPFKQVGITVHRMTRSIVCSMEFMADSVVGPEQWIAGKFGDKFARQEASDFVKGNGVNKARGFTTYDNGTNFGQVEQIGSGTSAKITYDGLVNLLMALKGGYQARATFGLGRSALAQCMLLKDGEGRPLWMPSLVAGQPSLLLGRPVAQFEDMPTPAAGSLSVVCADFTAFYIIADRVGFTLLRDDYTKAPDLRFIAAQRVGGGVGQFEAGKLLVLT